MSKLATNKPLLILLYGFPGSGKTYFARQLGENLQAAHIQHDRIRYELFDKPRYDKQENNLVNQLADYMTEEFLSAGLNVIYDTNSFRASQRHNLRDLARRSGATTALVWLQIDTDSAFLRNSKRDRRRMDDKYAAGYDKKSFSEAIAHMQNPGANEDYIVISGKHTFRTQFSAIVRYLREQKLVSSSADEYIVKPGMVNLVPSPSAGRVDMARRNIVIR